MKLINKTLALLLACCSVGLVQAGDIEWRTTNLTESLNTYELDDAIRQGIGTAGNLPDLPKPWFLQFTLVGDAANNNSSKPVLIVIEKARGTASDKTEYACRKFQFGIATKTGFLEDLREQARIAAGYATTHQACFVNDPAPAKKSSKK